MLNMAYPQPRYVSQICIVFTTIAGKKSLVQLQGDREKREGRENAKPGTGDFSELVSVKADPS